MATLDLGKLVSESMQNLNEGTIEENKLTDALKKVGSGAKTGADKVWGGVKSGAGAVGRGATAYKDTMKDQWGKGKAGKAKAIGMGAAVPITVGALGLAGKKVYDKNRKKKNQQQ